MRTLPFLLIPAVLLVGCTELGDVRERTTLQQREIERLRTERNQWRDDYYGIHERYEELSQRRKEFDCGRLILTHLGAEMTHRRGTFEIETADDGLVVKL